MTGLVERPLPGNGHGGCGRRLGETHRRKHRQGAPGRPHGPVLGCPLGHDRHREYGNLDFPTASASASSLPGPGPAMGRVMSCTVRVSAHDGAAAIRTFRKAVTEATVRCISIG
jgi:hypothetical protein